MDDNVLKMEEEKFKCDHCGLCCKNLHRSTIYASLDRGDGTCRYFDVTESICSIYENRPIVCNIDAMYARYFADQMSKDKYYELNYSGCDELKKDIT